MKKSEKDRLFFSLLLYFLLFAILGAVFGRWQLPNETESILILLESFSMAEPHTSSFILSVISSARWEIGFLLLLFIASALSFSYHASCSLFCFRGFLFGLCGIRLLPLVNSGSYIPHGFLIRNALFVSIALVYTAFLFFPGNVSGRYRLIERVLSTATLSGLSLLIQYLYILILFTE